MASVYTLLLISLIVLFGCHYREVGAGYGKGRYGKGRDREAANRFRNLKFSLIISGQRICRLQETIGQPLYQERLYCDTGITVTDPTEDMLDPDNQGLFDRIRPSTLPRPTDRPSGFDNATSPTAISLTRRRFCAHRAVLAARSKYLENLISNALGSAKSYSVRHIAIEVVDIPPDVFEFILQYIYTYQIDNFDPERHIIDLFVASHLMQLTELTDSILDYILNDMQNSIEQMHKIITWLKWAQRNRNYQLERTLITVIRKVLKLETDWRWQEFGRIICEITQADYVGRPRTEERAQPLIRI